MLRTSPQTKPVSDRKLVSGYFHGIFVCTGYSFRDGAIVYSQQTNVFPYTELNGKYSIPLTSINCTLYNTAQFSPISVTNTSCFHALSYLFSLTHTFFFLSPAISLRQSNQSDATPSDDGEEEESNAGQE